MAVTWSSPKAPPPWDGAVRCAQAACTTGNEAATAGATDGLDLRQLTAIHPHLEIATKASGTIRISKLLPGDTLTINGTVFTAVAPSLSAPTAVQFRTGTDAGPDNGDDYLAAMSLAAAINANGAVNATLRADAASDEAIVTITALADGVAGNALTLATSSARAVLSGATLAGGAAVGVAPAGARLEASVLNPITGRWNRAPDFDVPIAQGVGSQALLPVSVKAQTGRMQLVPNGMGLACMVYMLGISGRIP